MPCFGWLRFRPYACPGQTGCPSLAASAQPAYLHLHARKRRITSSTARNAGKGFCKSQAKRLQRFSGCGKLALSSICHQPNISVKRTPTWAKAHVGTLHSLRSFRRHLPRALGLQQITHMAAPSGPDNQTWKRMTPTTKIIYWCFVIFAFSVIAYIWFY